MKEYFSHDYNARSDTRMVKLQMKHGLAGLGAYWCIIEMLYEEGGYLPIDEYARITFELRANYDTITSIIQDFELFKNDGEKFWSESALKRLGKRAEISETARQNISKRWDKYGRNTGVLPSNNGRNTIKLKESKIKEKNIQYAENVFLSEKDHKKLIELYGESATIRMIEILDNYKGSKGVKYKDDYRAILNWVVGRYKEELEKKSLSLPGRRMMP
jgi:hypothetical protein